MEQWSADFGYSDSREGSIRTSMMGAREYGIGNCSETANDAMNYGGLMYCDQRSATFNSYDYTRATASVPAGTSLFLSTNYSNVDESSTNFRQLKKSAAAESVGDQVDNASSQQDASGRHSVTRRRLDFDDSSSTSSSSSSSSLSVVNDPHTEQYHHQQQQQPQQQKAKDSARVYRPWEESRPSTVVRPWELSPVISTNQHNSTSSSRDFGSTVTNSVHSGPSADHTDSGYCSQTPIQVSSHTTDQRATERKVGGGGFDPATVRLLETWYAANIRHPYPDDVTLAALATGGGISVKQVRKWLANRRVRSCNTLTYNGAVHPQRLRRLRRQQRRAQTAVDDVVEPRHSTPLAAAAVGPSAAGFPVPSSSAEFIHHDAIAFQTSTPLSGGAFHRLDVDSTGISRDAAAGRRHHPYFVAAGRVGPWRQVTPAALRRCCRGNFTATSATAAAVANFESVHQVATAQLSVFNIVNSVRNQF